MYTVPIIAIGPTVVRLVILSASFGVTVTTIIVITIGPNNEFLYVLVCKLIISESNYTVT